MKTSAKPTVYDIKREYNSRENGHFFDRSSMRFFGDTMRSFGTIIIADELYLYRKPTARVNVFGRLCQAGREFFGAWHVNESSWDLDPADDATKNMIWNRI